MFKRVINMNTELTIDSRVIEHIRTIEASLKDSLNFDQFNGFDIAKLLDKKKCILLLSDCVLSKYCISLYTNYIYPLYFYLEWTNNYLTIEKLANDYDLTIETAKSLIDTGRAILNTINK